MNESIARKAIRSSIWDYVWGSVRNSILDSVWSSAGSVHGSYVRNSVGMALKISVEDSAREYFKQNE